MTSLILLVCVVYVSIGCCVVGDEFEPVCSSSEKARYSPPSPPTVLPQPDDGTMGGPSRDEIERWYKVGAAECMAFMGSDEFKSLIKKKVQSPIIHNPNFTPRPEGRGVPLLYKLTGMIPWVFGPNNCTTHSKCWLGILTCGDTSKTYTNIRGLQERYKAYWNEIRTRSHSNITIDRWKSVTYAGWSPRALQINIRLIGPEIVAPLQRHLPVCTDGNCMDVLVADYTLTVPGQYNLETRMMWFYPNALFKWTPAEVKKGINSWYAVYMGGTEYRCKRYSSCGAKSTWYMEECDRQAFLPRTPRAITVSDGAYRCRSHASSKSLPICTSGNHSGRWIVLPDIVSKQCGAAPYSYLKPKPAKAPHEKLEYFTYADTLSPSYMWGDMYTQMKEEAIDDNNLYSGKLTDAQIHLLELSRYANGKICSLYYVGEMRPEYVSRLQIYAPYECKYEIMGRKEAIKCLNDRNLTNIFLHGDSQVRGLTTSINHALGLSELSAAEMKEMTNVKGYKELKTDKMGVHIGFHNAWSDDETVDKIMSKPYPDVYIQNMALSHNLQLWGDLDNYEKYLQNTHWLKFWQRHQYSNAEYLPRIKIYLNGNNLYSNAAFYGSIGEVIRRTDRIVSKLYVDDLKFEVIDMYLLTSANLDLADGFHDSGTTAKMKTFILLNMLCKSTV